MSKQKMKKQIKQMRKHEKIRQKKIKKIYGDLTKIANDLNITTFMYSKPSLNNILLIATMIRQRITMS